MAVDPTTLVLRIVEAFDPTAYPGDGRIVHDTSGLDPESIRIRDALKGRHWRDVPFETLERLRFALPFLSAEGYRFYLPAFMVSSIVDFARASVIADEIVRSLLPPRPPDVERIRDLATAYPEMQPSVVSGLRDRRTRKPDHTTPCTFAGDAAGLTGWLTAQATSLGGAFAQWGEPSVHPERLTSDDEVDWAFRVPGELAARCVTAACR